MRYEFGAGVADFIVAPADGIWTVGAATSVTLWSAATDGTQYTDLLDGAGSPIAQIASDEHGALPRFFGPDGVAGMWADASGGTRAWMDAHRLTSGVPGAEAGPVMSVNGMSGDVILTASDVGALADDGGRYSVVKYGAVGDGLTDDRAAIQAALDAAYAAGGGVVVLPPGRTYGIGSPVHILTGTTVVAYGATIRGIGGVTLAKLYRDEDTALTGYSGHSRIRILGGTWDVNAFDGTTGIATGGANGFVLSHCDTVQFRDVTIQNVSSVHAIDATASQNLQIVSCRFEGFIDNTVDSSSSFRESIQLDYAINNSGINGAFDGTPCKNVLVRDCWFGPSARLGPPGRAVGSHTSYNATTWCENIQILGNTIAGTRQEGIRAYAWKNAVIADNVIGGTGAPGITVTGPDPTVAGYAIACQDISVHGNVVSGPVSGGSSPIRVVGWPGALPAGLSISGNTISSSPSTGIYVSYADQPQVSDNQTRATVSSGIYAINCTAPQLTGNLVRAAGGVGVGLDICTGGHMGGNVVEGGGGHGILVNGGSDISVMGNRVVGVATSGIRATTAAVRPRIMGNAVIRRGTIALGIDVTASVTGAVVIGNDLSNGSWPTNTALSLLGPTGGTPATDWAGGRTNPGNNLVANLPVA